MECHSLRASDSNSPPGAVENRTISYSRPDTIPSEVPTVFPRETPPLCLGSCKTGGLPICVAGLYIPVNSMSARDILLGVLLTRSEILAPDTPLFMFPKQCTSPIVCYVCSYPTSRNHVLLAGKKKKRKKKKEKQKLAPTLYYLLPAHILQPLCWATDRQFSLYILFYPMTLGITCFTLL